jgi:hypothetical protein
MNLDQNLLGSHDLDDFADVGPRLLQQTKLLAQQAHPRVVVVALSLETS